MSGSVTQQQAARPTLAVHKLTSCSGCQAVLLNLGDDLLHLLERVELVHFVEAGICSPQHGADIALVEGSITSAADEARLLQIRAQSRLVVAVGACACAGGVQALRNVRDSRQWAGTLYADPQHVDSLAGSRAIGDLIHVDLELWGCPISAGQLLAALDCLLRGTLPSLPSEKVCQQCKRQQQVCLLVTGNAPCLGPVTRTGCGALCPQFGAACYGCFGPSEQANCSGLARRLTALGLPPARVAEYFASVSVGAPEFSEIYRQLQSERQDGEPKQG